MKRARPAELLTRNALPEQLPKKRTYMLWLVAIMWVSALIGLLLLTQTDSAVIFTLGPGFAFGVPLLGIALCVVIWLWAIHRGRFDPFEFPTWFSLNVYIQVLVNSWFFGPISNINGPFWLANNTEELATKTLLLFGLGLASLWGGYVWFSNRLSTRSFYQGEINLTNVKLEKLYIAWCLTAGLVLLSTIVGLSGFLGAGRFEELRNYSHYVQLFRDGIAFLIMIAYFKKPSQSRLIWLIIVISTTFSLEIFNGSKKSIFVFLYLIMAYYYVHRKFKREMLIGGVLVIIVTVPLVNVYRAALFTETERSTNMGRLLALDQAIEELLQLNFESLFAGTRDTLVARQGGQLELTGAILLIHPEYEQFVGEEISSVILQSMIPKVLWPSKPTGHLGPYSRIRSTYLGLPENVGGLVMPGPIADSYRFGGLISTVIWMFIIGMLGAWFYHRGPLTGQPFGTMIYLIIIVHIVVFDSALLSIVVAVFQLIVLLMITSFSFSIHNTLSQHR